MDIIIAAIASIIEANILNTIKSALNVETSVLIPEVSEVAREFKSELVLHLVKLYHISGKINRGKSRGCYSYDTDDDAYIASQIERHIQNHANISHGFAQSIIDCQAHSRNVEQMLKSKMS